MKFITYDGNRFKRQKHILKELLHEMFNILYIQENYYIAGGTIRSIFAGEKINDVDIYFVKDFNDHKKFDLIEYKLEFETDFAKSYNVKGHKVQFIKITGTPEEVMSKFDYTISMGAYDPYNDKFILEENFLYNLAERRLVFNDNTEFPISSLWRMKKFLNRGYKIDAKSVITLALSIHKLKIDDYTDLKKQLDGIDTLLLKDITDKLIEDKKEAKYDFEEFIAYLEKAIDKIWKVE